MVPKSVNPHSLSQDVEITTRSEIAERAGLGSFARDEENRILKRDLDTLLRGTWADVLAETSTSSRHGRTSENRNTENVALMFRLVSSMKRPRNISLDPRPPPLCVSREPDYEDDKTQAETRKIRSLSVAVEFETLRNGARQIGPKAVSVDVKIPVARSPFPRPLTALLVTEETRASKTSRHAKPSLQSPATSPHEPRVFCDVLPVTSASNRTPMRGKRRRKRDSERPPPAYWRPSPGLGGKCMGYALGYPSSWAPGQRYARDTMKGGVESGHAVHDEPE